MNMELNIESLVETQVKRELEEMDLRGIVESEVRSAISKGIGKEIVSNVAAAAKDMMAEEVRKAIDGEITTDDGWGHRKTYASFEELFKQTFKSQMDAKYEVKREIERLVKERVESLIRQDYNRVLEKITDEISKSRLVKKPGEL